MLECSLKSSIGVEPYPSGACVLRLGHEEADLSPRQTAELAEALFSAVENTPAQDLTGLARCAAPRMGTPASRAAAVLGVSPGTVRKWARDGLIEAHKVRGEWRVSLAGAAAYAGREDRRR